MTVTVTPVLDRAALRIWVELDRVLYASDPTFVAPNALVRTRRLLARRPFRPEGHFRLLLAERAGRAVARIAVYRDPQHDRHRSESTCFFGYLDCGEDLEAAAALLDEAERLARTWKAETLRGPRGLTRVDERGVLVEGTHTAPFLTGHHPPNLAPFLTSRGFQTHHEALAYAIELRDPQGRRRPLPKALEARARSVDIPDLEVRPCRWRQIRRDLDLAYTVMVDGFRAVPDNTPLPRTAFQAIGVPLLTLTHSSMLQLATVAGQAAGFALCFPELNEALHATGGRLGPRSLWRLLRSGRRIRTASFKLLGVLPQYRGSGLHARLIRQAIAGVQDRGYDRLEASLIDSRNAAMRRIVEGAGMTVYRRYRVVERPLAP